MSRAIKLMAAIPDVLEQEKVLRETLHELPESNVDAITGVEDAVAAIERLCAAETIRIQAEADLSTAMAKVRAYVQANWKAGEIPEGTMDVLNCW